MLDNISSITNIVVNIINISNGIINWPEPYSLGILLCYGLECLTYNRNISIIFVVLMIIAVKIFNIFENNKVSKNKDDVKRTTIEKDDVVVIHDFYNLTHDYRNNINELIKLYKENSLSVESLTQIVKNELELMLGYLCNTMQFYTGVKISACVKIVTNTRKNAIKFNNAKPVTMVRSKNSDPLRSEIDSSNKEFVKVCDNTDFLEIVSGNTIKGYFYQCDLIEYSERMRRDDKEYKNTNSKWRDFYRSTIVIPLKISNEKIFYSQQDTGYTLMGFLCVDSMSNEVFIESREKLYINIMKIYGYLIFDILSKYKYYLEKV